MVAYSFKQRFVAKIEKRQKRQTIRANGKRRHARAGEQLQLYTGMRTKSCRLVLRETCTAAFSVEINIPLRKVTIDGVVDLTGDELEDFARLDGFDDFADMVDFWRTEHPGIDLFRGTLIRWGTA